MGTPYSLSARCVQTHPSLNAASLIKQMKGGADPTDLLLARESAPPSFPEGLDRGNSGSALLRDDDVVPELCFQLPDHICDSILGR